MNRRLRVVSLWLSLSAVGWSGCCCCNPAALSTSGTQSATIEADDGQDPEEVATATEYAQKALGKLGYGEVLTARLKKDGLYWYVDGTAGGKEGGTVSYIVMFQVSQVDNRQTWAAKTVTIDDEVVFPKGG